MTSFTQLQAVNQVFFFKITINLFNFNNIFIYLKKKKDLKDLKLCVKNSVTSSELDEVSKKQLWDYTEKKWVEFIDEFLIRHGSKL